jgi:hypothetical protein
VRGNCQQIEIHLASTRLILAGRVRKYGELQ